MYFAVDISLAANHKINNKNIICYFNILIDHKALSNKYLQTMPYQFQVINW